MELNEFRTEIRAWIEANFPKSLKRDGLRAFAGEEKIPKLSEPAELWRSRLAERGLGVPTWPVEYGGAGYSEAQARIVRAEMGRVGAFNPIPFMVGMGATMIGPTLLDYGTDEQKQRHLPGIASGLVRWCVGYSEPNAGSDLASLQTKAEDKDDHWLINGQKTWTSGAHLSDWCGALMRTDPKAEKRRGISFIMLPMHQKGVETRRIRLINGTSIFCETFFTNAEARKDDLLGELNDG